MSIRGIIFDLDGTLADTLGDIASAANRVLAAQQLKTHSLAAYRAMLGEGAVVLMSRALPPERQDLLDVSVASFRTVYSHNQLGRTQAYPGIVELLTELSRRRLPLFVLSNKPHEATVTLIEQLFSQISFIAVAGQQQNVPLKPDPTAALAMAHAAQLAPEAMAMVGDTGIDMETGRRARMRPIGVSWGFRDTAELQAHGAAWVIDTPEQLLDVL